MQDVGENEDHSHALDGVVGKTRFELSFDRLRWHDERIKKRGVEGVV
jgi:hypothetical protein